MPNIVYCHFAETDRGFIYGELEKGEYDLTWEVCVDDENLAGPYVLELARNATLSSTVTSTVAKYGDPYTYLGFTDGGSFARGFYGKLKDVTNPRLWVFGAHYTPPAPSETVAIAQDPNPLNHGVEYWIEWVEEQVPVEKAYCFTRLDHIYRGPNYLPGKTSVREPGHIVNACNQQTVDPVMKSVFHPILCAQYNAPTYLDAIYLNRVWGDTVNGDGDAEWAPYSDKPKFLGDNPRTWRFLVATSERRQQVSLKNPLAVNPIARNVVISFYPTLVKMEYRPKTWDLEIVNNGMVAFRYRKGTKVADLSQFGYGTNKHLILKRGEDESGIVKGDLFSGEVELSDNLALFPTQVYSEPGSKTKVDAAEPQLLNLDGVQLDPNYEHPPEPQYINYRYLEEVLYGGTSGIIIPWKAGLTPGLSLTGGSATNIPLF